MAILSAVENDSPIETKIRLAYQDFRPKIESDPVPIFLIHGSPGDGSALESLAEKLSENRRVIVPDLPGFGDSTADIPDYSFRAHAQYVLELADELKIDKFDALGFSMGGGVVLHMSARAADRVRSVELVSAIGVQEYELLGDYRLNHLLHGLQLAGFWLLREGFPHFGIIGKMPITYSRNFYDSDQRPLRQILETIDIPVLIVHGTKDPLVPVDAAREHARLAAQSKFIEYPDESHFMVFMHPEKLGVPIENFLNEVKVRSATTRQSAEPARIADSTLPFKLNISEAQGVAAFVIFLLIALATLISEDLAAISAGVLAGNGRISLTLAIIASFFGIYIGDLMLYLAGKWFGRSALKKAPIRWFLTETSVDSAAKWFKKRGAAAILLSRFTPSFRLPTYFSAGMFGMGFVKFSLLSAIAVSLWTPILVMLSAWLGAETIDHLFSEGRSVVWKAALILFAGYFLIRFLMKLRAWKDRRRLIGRLKRLRNWEFWPLRIFYFPVVAYFLVLAVKHRSLNVFTCANPGILAGGFVGESKFAIYERLAESGENSRFLPKYAMVPGRLSTEERLKIAADLMRENGIQFPIVLKPDVGERGKGVEILHSVEILNARIESLECDIILQEFIEGVEASVFYYRHPNEQNGKIFSITEKKFPSVVGDGISTLEVLILKDKRAVCLAEKYFDRNAEKLDIVLPAGEEFQIIDIGTHSRGAIFLDGEWIKTRPLEDTIDKICRRFDGFFFGRFDIRAGAFADLQLGEDFKIIELNGVTSESTNIYDPKFSLIEAYRILFRQWRIAFEIGAENQKRGAKPTSVADLLKLIRFGTGEAIPGPAVGRIAG